MSYTEKYNQLTRTIAIETASSLAGFFTGHNIHLSEEEQKRLEDILYAMLYTFRTTVINERVDDQFSIHLDHFHGDRK